MLVSHLQQTRQPEERATDETSVLHDVNIMRSIMSFEYGDLTPREYREPKRDLVFSRSLGIRITRHLEPFRSLPVRTSSVLRRHASIVIGAIPSNGSLGLHPIASEEDWAHHEQVANGLLSPGLVRALADRPTDAMCMKMSFCHAVLRYRGSSGLLSNASHAKE